MSSSSGGGGAKEAPLEEVRWKWPFKPQIWTYISEKRFLLKNLFRSKIKFNFLCNPGGGAVVIGLVRNSNVLSLSLADNWKTRKSHLGTNFNLKKFFDREIWVMHASVTRLAAFWYFCTISKVFGSYLQLYLVFGKILNLLWLILYAFGQIWSLLSIAKYRINNRPIWSHWLLQHKVMHMNGLRLNRLKASYAYVAAWETCDSQVLMSVEVLGSFRLVAGHC